MKQSSRYMRNMGRAAVCLGVLTLLGSGCSVTDHEHPAYKANVQAVNDAAGKADAAAGRAEAAADKANAAAGRADAAAGRAEAAADKANAAAGRAEAAAERAERAADKAAAMFEKTMRK